MPGMSGRELAQLLTEARPGLRTLFMSGYSGEAIAERGLPQGLAAFIGKPFEPEDLADRVRDVLDRAS
jgi:DNA-binding NarL/FixJ family response regulator